jgi:long-chain acyl-CoA synthetase
MSLDLRLPEASDSEDQPATICSMFDRAVSSVPERTAIRHLDSALTYHEMGRAVTALAHRLASVAEPGATMALVLPNSIEFQVGYLAALKALIAPALLNPLYPAAQLAPLLREVRPKVILCSPATHETVAEIARDLGIPAVICLGRDVSVLELAAEAATSVFPRNATPADVSALLFSGGTTGVPKAVEYTHGRLGAAVRSMAYIWPAQDDEVFLPIAPFTHIYGFLIGALLPLYVRGETVIPERFQPERIVELLVRHRVTFFGGGPPAIYAGLLAAHNLQSADLAALRMCPAGGAPFPVELIERWRRATGLEIREGYGMTELAPISGVSPGAGLRPGSAGKAVPGVEVQAVDLEEGLRVLPPREHGELRIRGPQMMTGYRNRPEETAQTIRNGFIYTGDIGYLDEDGFLFITDRKKDIVFVKGFNVFPREVEEVIHGHPKVRMASVIGVPDARTGGERLIAFVTARAGELPSAPEITAYCATRLVSYKCPGEVRIVDGLPLTPAQKVDVIALRRLAAALQAEPAFGHTVENRKQAT